MLTHPPFCCDKNKLHKPRAVEKQQDLGVLFLGFLKLYGQEFNYFRYACHSTRTADAAGADLTSHPPTI